MGGPSAGRLDAPVTVHAVGSGGVDEVRACLADAEVAWMLLRMEVGSGAFARTKFIAVHFNGDDVPVVQRGRLNSRNADVLAHFGEVHATLEFKRQEEFTVDAICEELLPFLTSDSNLDGGLSAKSLKQAYEELVMKQKASSKRESIRSIPRTARECNAGRRVSARDALTAVGARRGPYNWVLLEPTKLELHNAGYGGLEELKAWLEDDKVFFGVIRFSFGHGGGAAAGSQDTVKYVFVHWVGPDVPAVQRGRWNTQIQAADAMVHQACTVITLRKEVHTPDDLDVAQIVSELRRLSVVDGTSEGAAGSISVEEYKAALQKECEDIMEADRSEGEEEALAQALPSVPEAVEAVRKAGEVTWNWLLVGLGPPAPVQRRLSLAERPSAEAGPQHSASSPPAPPGEPEPVPSGPPEESRPEAGPRRSAGPPPAPPGEPAAAPSGLPEEPRPEAGPQRSASPLPAPPGEPAAVPSGPPKEPRPEAGPRCSAGPPPAPPGEPAAVPSGPPAESRPEAGPRRSAGSPPAPPREPVAAPSGPPEEPRPEAAAAPPAPAGAPAPAAAAPPAPAGAPAPARPSARASVAAPAPPPPGAQPGRGSLPPAVAATAIEAEVKQLSVPKGPALVSRAGPATSQHSRQGGPEPGGSSSSSTAATNRLPAPAAPQVRAWEVKPGTLRLRTGWWWSRRHFELRAGRLRWWRKEEDFEREADPLGEIALVRGEMRWHIEHVRGAQLELICHRSDGEFRGGHHVERYMLMADDERDASEWAEAIGQHIRYVDMLLSFPLPLEGRQGDVRNYGITYPDALN